MRKNSIEELRQELAETKNKCTELTHEQYERNCFKVGE